MGMHNPLNDPLFWATLKIVGVLFGLGFVLVLFFARRNIRAGLRGELGQRYVGWIIVAPTFLLAAFLGGPAAAMILLLFCYRVVSEYVCVVGVKRPYTVYLYALVPLTLVIAAAFPELYFALPAGCILLLTLVPILAGQVEDVYFQLSLAGRGYLYLVWATGHLILLKQIGGVGMLLVVGIGVALSDVMQYTVGKLAGKHVISPKVHPRKAWEGLLGTLAGAMMAVALFDFALPAAFSLPHKITLAFLIGLGAAWGDLISSLIKRAAGAKDWGDIIPGHGGLLDRVNSMVVVVPLVFYFSYIVI
jgi:phosphatidate cytidylyltransferase